MTRAEVENLLSQLNLSRDMNSYDVRSRLERLGYGRSEVSVNHGATKICLVFKDTDFIVKWSYECEDEEDESVKECNIYALAVEAGLAFIFPKTEILGGNGAV